MPLVGGAQHLFPSSEYSLCLSIVNHLRGEQTDSCMPVLFVVPGEEHLTETASVFDSPEAIWKLRPVLQGLELGFGVGVVVTGVGLAVSLGDPQVSEQ